MKTLIIEKPSLAPLPNRIGWACFTAICWMAWIYLWMPLLTLLLWWLGFSLVDNYLFHISLNEWAGLKDVLILYPLIVLAMGMGLLVWAGAQFVRFRNNHQRRRPAPVKVEELAEFAQIQVRQIIELNASRGMIAHHAENGRFLYAETEEQRS